MPSGNCREREFKEIYTYLILTTHHTRGTHAFLHSGTSSYKPVSLERLIILDMLRKLSQRVARGRALWATEERHREETKQW